MHGREPLLAAAATSLLLALPGGCFDEPAMRVDVSRPDPSFALSVRPCADTTLNPTSCDDQLHTVFTAGIGDNQSDIGISINDGTQTLTLDFRATGMAGAVTGCTMVTITDPGDGVHARAAIKADGMLEFLACPTGACVVHPTHPDCP